MTIIKSRMTDIICRKNGYSRKKSMQIVESLIDIVKKQLASGDDVLISGFGKFSVNEKSERRGRNPATGGAMMLRARRVVTFKCSGKLRDRINRK